MWFWIVALTVLVVGFAAAWWSSGRSGPLRNRKSGPENDEAVGRVLAERFGRDVYGIGPGGNY